jgi:hypothetical protein
VLVELSAVAAVSPAEAVATVVAQDPAPPPGKGEEFGTASPVALVVILSLAVVTIALIVSMSRRIRRLPKSFDEPTDAKSGTAARDDAGTSSGERPEQR